MRAKNRMDNKKLLLLELLLGVPVNIVTRPTFNAFFKEENLLDRMVDDVTEYLAALSLIY